MSRLVEGRGVGVWAGADRAGVPSNLYRRWSRVQQSLPELGLALHARAVTQVDFQSIPFYCIRSRFGDSKVLRTGDIFTKSIRVSPLALASEISGR